MLQPRKLHKLLRPNRTKIAMLPGSRYNRAGNQILVGVHDFVVLQTEEGEEVNVLFHECYCLLVWLQLLTFAILRYLICREHYALGHENLHDVVE